MPSQHTSEESLVDARLGAEAVGVRLDNIPISRAWIAGGMLSDLSRVRMRIQPKRIFSAPEGVDPDVHIQQVWCLTDYGQQV